MPKSQGRITGGQGSARGPSPCLPGYVHTETNPERYIVCVHTETNVGRYIVYVHIETNTEGYIAYVHIETNTEGYI